MKPNVDRLGALGEPKSLRWLRRTTAANLAAPYDLALVERGPLGGVQLGGAEEVGDIHYLCAE